MLRLGSSELALGTLLVVQQREAGVRAMEVSRGLRASYTGAGKALQLLEGDGLVTRAEHRYRLVASARTAAAVDFAIAALDPERVIEALAAGNRAVEFAGTGSGRLVVVLRRFSDPGDEDRLTKVLQRLAELWAPTGIVTLRKEEVLRELEASTSLRLQASTMRVLSGTVDRSFPDRTRHGDVAAESLGRLHPTIEVPSHASLGRLAKTYGLRRIVAFGSSTRADFRPDSDIDLLVDARPGRFMTVGERVRFTAEAERLFDRDVDVVMTPIHRESLARRVERDGVVVYEAAG
ncbi:MAG: nucleotidyltransferase domain-containing protein [Chloroflexota bacterium]